MSEKAQIEFDLYELEYLNNLINDKYSERSNEYVHQDYSTTNLSAIIKIKAAILSINKANNEASHINDTLEPAIDIKKILSKSLNVTVEEFEKYFNFLIEDYSRFQIAKTNSLYDY